MFDNLTLMGQNQEKIDLLEKQLSETAAIREALNITRRELEQTRKEFSDYKADHARKDHENKLEQAEVNKKNRRRSWLQVIIPLILSPLITLFIEHFQEVSRFVDGLFH